MGFYINDSVQTIAPGASAVFYTSVRDRSGNIHFADGTGAFSLSGGPNRRSKCPCCNDPCKEYAVNFGANIAIPTGGTVGDISVAIAVNGAAVPASTMIVTPAAVEEYFNVSREMPVPIWCGCCQTVTITNTSDQAILMQNATLEIA